MTPEAKKLFAKHLGQYADHERLHDEPFAVWAERFIDEQIKDEALRLSNSGRRMYEIGFRDGQKMV